MYYFNKRLFCNLDVVFGTTKVDISQRLYGNTYQYVRRSDNPLSMRFSELVEICNELCFPLKSFIQDNETETIFCEQGKYVISRERFIPIVFRPSRIKHVYGPEGMVRGLTRRRFASDMKVSYISAARWSDEDHPIVTVRMMLDMCNTYELDLTHFVDDKNGEIPPVKRPDMPETTRRMWQEVTDLRKAVEEYKKKIREMSREITDLKLSAHGGRMLAEDAARYDTEGRGGGREWTFNFRLLNSLHRIVGVSKVEIQRSAGVRAYKTDGLDGSLSVKGFVDLCNRWKISIYHFFVRGDQNDYPIREYSYYETEDWKPVKFYPEYVSDLYGKDSMTGLKMEDIISAGIASAGDLRGWRKAESSMDIGDMLRLCNALDVTPSCFITDKNRPALACRVTTVEFLLEENRLLRRKIMRLKKKGGIPEED